MPRKAKINRKTKETSIAVEVNIDGKGNYNIDTKIGFLNHMLEQFSKHSLNCSGVAVGGSLDSMPRSFKPSSKTSENKNLQWDENLPQIFPIGNASLFSTKSQKGQMTPLFSFMPLNQCTNPCSSLQLGYLKSGGTNRKAPLIDHLF